MNYKQLIMISSFVFASNITKASVSKTCLQRTYRATKRVIITGIVGTYIHQNIMTEQDLTKVPNLSIEDIADYKNKLSMTLQNGCASFDKTYTSLKKLTSGLKPSSNFGTPASFVDADIHNDYSQFQHQKDTERSVSIELEMDNQCVHYETATALNDNNDVNSKRRD